MAKLKFVNLPTVLKMVYPGVNGPLDISVAECADKGLYCYENPILQKNIISKYFYPLWNGQELHPILWGGTLSWQIGDNDFFFTADEVRVKHVSAENIELKIYRNCIVPSPWQRDYIVYDMKSNFDERIPGWDLFYLREGNVFSYEENKEFVFQSCDLERATLTYKMTFPRYEKINDYRYVNIDDSSIIDIFSGGFTCSHGSWPDNEATMLPFQKMYINGRTFYVIGFYGDAAGWYESDILPSKDNINVSFIHIGSNGQADGAPGLSFSYSNGFINRFPQTIYVRNLERWDS